jgi:hypothetical protein
MGKKIYDVFIAQKRKSCANGLLLKKRNKTTQLILLGG